MHDWQYPTAVEVVWPYTLIVTFEGGSRRRVDCTNALVGPIFAPLHDPLYFARARFSEDANTVEWPNGADLAPEFLWETGVEVVAPSA